MQVYHYITKGSNVLQDGLMSFAKSPNVNIEYYTQRSGQKTQQGIAQWMDSKFPGYSRGIRCFAEPIQWTEKSINLKRLVDAADMLSIDVDALQKDGLLEAVYLHTPLPENGHARAKVIQQMEQDDQDGFQKINIDDVGKIKANWDVCNDSLGQRFAFVPFYLLVLKDGVIPPKYLTVIPKQKEKGSARVQRIERIRDYFDFYENQVLPLVKEIATQKPDGFHGLYTHTDAVVFRGIDYALALNKDPIPVIFACACHDAAKATDTYNSHHGHDALPIAKQVMEKFPKLLTPEICEDILYAVEHHTLGTKAPDYISACLWDADRTRLSWIRGYDDVFFATERAKKVASKTAKVYVQYMNRCLGRPLNEDREESVARSDRKHGYTCQPDKSRA